MEWSVVTVIVVLVGLFAAIAGPIIKPVSYTHLDVYKRQAPALPMAEPEEGVTPYDEQVADFLEFGG